jgi:hypothetical protein
MKACLPIAALAAPLALVTFTTRLHADDAPPWMRDAAAAPVPKFDKPVSAYVLLNEGTTTVDPDGRLVTTERRVLKVLNREGRREAAAYVSYTSGESKVRDLRAWLLRPSGAVRKYDKADVADFICYEGYVYDECRVRGIHAKDDADVGSVFGYEAVVESRPLFGQDSWSFQDDLPVRLSRFTVTVPEGWRAEGRVLNHAPAEPAAAGRSSTWELHDLAPIEDEPLGPPAHQLRPRLALNLVAPAGAGASAPRSFAGWSDLARWYSDLVEPQAQADAAITARVGELTAGARTPGERARAIARYVQATNYAAIEMGVGRYRPHAAAEVFAKSYGDCKDKANLMHVMLKAAGIASHLVLIYAGDPGFVREDWVSPLQFNHAVLAVALDEALPARVDGLKTGPLVVFDPTDPFTPFGELPEHEQGSLALIAAGDSGSLMRMPLSPPDANTIERTIEATVSPVGDLSATVHESAIGGRARWHRARLRRDSRLDYSRFVETWVGRSATAARVDKIEPVDDPATGRFTLDLSFSAPGYGQLMQGRLLIFKPFALSRVDFLPPSEPSRKNPVLLQTSAFSETVHVKLPEGFKLDELPEAMRLESAFGTYQTTVQGKGGELVVSRRLVVKRSTVPADQYGAVHDFFQKVRAAEASPVVLTRN